MASTGKRWLIGCGLGCLALIVVAVAVVVAFVVWIGGSGELLEPQKLLGADTTAYLEWSLTSEDPGTAALANQVIEGLGNMPPGTTQDLPPWFSGWLHRQQQREASQDVQTLFPMVAAWTLRPGEGPEDDLHLFSVSVQRFGNRLVFGDWIMGWVLPQDGDVRVERHRGEKIYQLPIKDESRVTFFIRGGNLFFTSDLDTARLAVDRLTGPAAASREPTDLDRLFAETGGALRGVIDNRRGEMLRAWQAFGGLAGVEAHPALWNGFANVTLSGGLDAEGALAVTLRFRGEKAWIEEHALELVMALHDGCSWSEKPVDVQARPFDGGLEVDVTIPELSRVLVGWLPFEHEIQTDSGTIRVDP